MARRFQLPVFPAHRDGRVAGRVFLLSQLPQNRTCEFASLPAYGSSICQHHRGPAGCTAGPAPPVDEDSGGGCGDGIKAVERDDPAFFESVFVEDRPADTAAAVLLFQQSDAVDPRCFPQQAMFAAVLPVMAKAGVERTVLTFHLNVPGDPPTAPCFPLGKRLMVKPRKLNPSPMWTMRVLVSLRLNPRPTRKSVNRGMT